MTTEKTNSALGTEL